MRAVPSFVAVFSGELKMRGTLRVQTVSFESGHQADHDVGKTCF